LNTQEITVQGIVFVAPAPYHEGYVLGSAEASVLNQTLAENLRNNFAPRMKKSETPLDQDDFDTYAAAYSFGGRVAGTRTVRNPVDTEERRLAKMAVNTQLKARGIKVKALDPEKYQGFINMAVATGRYRATAEEIVAAEQAGKTDGLEIDFGDIGEGEAAPESVAKPKRQKKAA
jgi:hypothetical protein